MGELMYYNKYITPTRIDYVASPLEPDGDGVRDIGYAVGKLSDGRPYRVECWCMDDLIMATIMLPQKGLEAWDRANMILLAEFEDLVKFVEVRPRLQAAKTTDDAGNEVWAINIMLRKEGKVYAELLMDLKHYVV
ncbi:MAG: hypothetical protein Q4D21_09645 [Phascolarctobacterium sp.]|nr:hypothetical protein [Phascolarctobacterium sp.]